MSSRSDLQWLLLRQTEQALSGWEPIKRAPRPQSGWVATIRHALGMSRAQLAERLGITRSSVVKLEERELGGGVTLDALSKAANALGCTVVYAIVPATGSLEELVAARARFVAQALAARTGHSMSLEDQASDADETLQQQRVVERRLLAEWPRDLWDLSWDARSNGSRADHG